jgi:hypothetical protein
MTTAQEWIQEFDLLYNSINSNIAPALDDYEKSVFLTMAQEELVKTLYSGGASKLDGFESSEQLRRALAILIKESTVSVYTTNSTNLGGVLYKLPDDVLYIIYEYIHYDPKDQKQDKIIVPTTHDDYYKTYNNPFKRPSSNRALRLDYNDNTVEIIGGDINGAYIIRYLRKPQPIILTDLTGSNDYINGKQSVSLCELDDSLHRTILQTAV